MGVLGVWVCGGVEGFGCLGGLGGLVFSSPGGGVGGFGCFLGLGVSGVWGFWVSLGFGFWGLEV